MSESGRPKNDSTFPSQTTTLLIGAMAPENSQLALNFEAIFPGATKVFPVFVKKPKSAHNDTLIGDSSDEERAEIHAAEVVAEELKEAKAAALLSAEEETEHKKQASPGSEAAPQAGK